VIATYSSTQVREPKLPFIQMMFLDLTLRMVIVYAMPEAAKEQAVRDTCRALEEGRLKHRIAHSLPFAEMAKAHELIEGGGFGGCVVVNIEE
jgi:NADPH2:quinone reductase